MMVIPAIDLKEGKAVRLYKGKMDQATVYSEDPVATALHWQSLGARLLHVVDLDGAFAGSPQNTAVIERIVSALDIPVQLGGGIRDMETIGKMFDLGVNRVILGTSAVRTPALVACACAVYGERIVLGLDAKDGKVAIEGWDEDAGVDALQLALEMKELGVQRLIFTDTSLDGTLQGVNLESTRQLAEDTGLKVIASGGVASMKDIEDVMKLEPYGVEGVITGKAIYSGALSFEDAVKKTAEGGV